MSIYGEDSITTTARLTYRPNSADSGITALLDRLNLYEDLDRLVPKAISAIEPALRLFSVVIIERYTHHKHVLAWYEGNTPSRCIREALASARMTYHNLVSSVDDDVPNAPKPVFHPIHIKGLLPQLMDQCEHKVSLPLVAGAGQNFGIIQFETEKKVETTDPEMELLQVFAHRIALGIDRDSLMHYQRKLHAIQYSANVKLAELEHQRLAAVEANAAKSQFLANISHEIRTPLGIIIGFSDLLGTQEVEADEREIFQATIRKNGQLLAKLIDDMLDLSKIEEGKIEFEFKYFPLAELLQDIRSTFLARARERGLSFTIDTEEGLPEMIHSDPFRLKQVLINLVNNALKFTESGGVTMRVWQKWANSSDKPDGPRKIHFEVRDTGLGICADEARRLFQPYTQANGATAGKYGGTGLGLVLAKRLANELGGDVVLKESFPGEGSIFEASVVHRANPQTWIKSPAPASSKVVKDAPKPEIAHWSTLHGKHILIADDALDNLLLFSTVLKAHGAEVDTARDGIEAVDMALSNSYDIILLDLQMPMKDGFAAAEELRERGFKKPILALTAMAMAEERAKAIEAGCNDHLSKPVKAEALVQKILELSS